MNPDQEMAIVIDSMAVDSDTGPNTDSDSQGGSGSGDLLVLDEAPDSDLVLPVWEATGNSHVDSALELIQSIDRENIDSHHAILTDVHDQLRDVMVNLDR